MLSQNLFIVPLTASWFLLALLDPAEAGFLSWLFGKGWNPPGNVKENYMFYGGRPSIHGEYSQINFGSVYEVTIQKQTRKNGGCVNTVKFGLQGRKVRKTLETKCLESRTRKIRNEKDFLLIGNPEDNFCVFTTNKNEVYYLQDGQWKKGDFSGDNTKDKELTPSEITAVKERINKWQAFFEKSDTEKQRIRGLKKAEKERFYGERARYRNDRENARQIHYANVNEIYRLKTEERNKHALEKTNIRMKRAKEGRSAAIEQLQTAEDERHEKRVAELEKMRDIEDKRYKTAQEDIEKKVSSEERKSEEELRKLDSLETEEEKRALQEMKENIKKGW